VEHRCSSKPRMAIFLLVPGAWLGGWCWRDVAAHLEADGHKPVGATLTGLGERAHLLSQHIGLHTHISDIVGMVNHRDLNEVVLVGHSYGGMVITGAAEQIPAHIRYLVYLDASVPRDGESSNDVIGPEMASRLRDSANLAGEGWKVPPGSLDGWALSDTIRPWVGQRLTPHPLATFEEPIRLGSKAAAALPRAFIRSSTKSALYARLMERARHAGWHCCDLKGGHYPMLTEPRLVASALTRVLE
jgi:pimeloyl-ACP methyl ester carboxylesterase